jgi:hypothetical protein
MTLFGVSSAPQPQPQAIQVLELDHHEAVPRNSSIEQVLRFSHSFLNCDDLAELLEKVDLIFETCSARKAMAATVSVPPRLHLLPGLSAAVRTFLAHAKKQRFRVYFDFGKTGPPPWMDTSHCVSDPLWFRGEAFSDYWRIHGWHSERWVRLYSKEDLDYLVQLTHFHKPAVVILGHSQRNLQFEEIRKILQTLPAASRVGRL